MSAGPPRRCALIRAVPIALKILLAIVVFGPMIAFAGVLVWGAIKDGRDERRSKHVTRG